MNDHPGDFLFCLREDLRRYRAVIHGQATGKAWPALFSPRFAPVLLYRLAFAFEGCGLGFVAKIFSLCNFVIFGIEIADRCPIGPGFVLPHTQGTVIGASRVGTNVTIFQGVTLGARELDIAYNTESRPFIGDGVIIGAGAKVLGGVRLGDYSRVGANAVVLESVPAGALAAGVPARFILSKQP